MNATLNGLTVPALKSIARDRGLRGYSRMRRADLINLLIEDDNTMKAEMAPVEIEFALTDEIDNREMVRMHSEAIEMDATIVEAYAPRAESFGISLPAYLACQTAHRIAGDVAVSGFWQCCDAAPVKVVIFDNGAKRGVCAKDAVCYSGEVTDMPAGMVQTCEGCGESFVQTDAPIEIAEEIQDAAYDRDYVIRKGSTLGMPFELWRNGLMMMNFANIRHLRMFLNMPAINSEEKDNDPMDAIRAAMTNGTAFQPAFMKNDSEEKEMDVNAEMLAECRIALQALMPILKRSKAAFELAKSNGDQDAMDMAYQVYSDTDTAIAEYTRTVAMMTPAEFRIEMTDHTCAHWQAEIGMSDCMYGCKVYACSKCETGARVVHNPTYGCKG
jgi:hypothetical protein